MQLETIRAAILASLIVGALWAVGVQAWWDWQAGILFSRYWTAQVLSVGFAVGMVSGLVTLLLGLPVHALLREFGRTELYAYSIAGLLLGGLIGLVGGLALGPGVLAWWCAPIGAFVATLFWLIRRPDRDAPNPPTSAS